MPRLLAGHFYTLFNHRFSQMENAVIVFSADFRYYGLAGKKG